MLLPGGVWVLGPGDASPEIRKIKAFMRTRFRSYAGDLADNGVFDQQMVDAVSEMQRRYGVTVTGYIGYSTKVLMGYLATTKVDIRPVLFTVCGTGVPWWVGPDADTARAVEGQYLWQPIGYRASAVPMGPSIKEGKAELRNQFNLHREQVERCGAAMAIYSQGAVIGSEVWEFDIKPPSGSLHWAYPHMKKTVAWGNPSREVGKAWPDPGADLAPANTGGVAYKNDRMKDTPDWWRNYAHKGDLYTTGTDDAAGQDKTAIWRIIRGEKFFVGPDTLLEQFLEVSQQPIPGAIGAFKAMFDALSFFGKQTGPHVNYNIGPAIDFLRS